MKRKITPILAALAVTLSVLASTAMAVETFTYDAKGNLTHIKGIPVEPISTPEEARIATEKRIAEIKAEEAKRAAQAAHASNISHPPSSIEHLFFTGKPYLEETGQYLFLFRHYDPELVRWTTADPSGFPDGANNILYVKAPTFIIDPVGLAWEYYNQFFGRRWETITYVTIETNKSIELTGVSVTPGFNSNGPTGALAFNFSIKTESTVVNSSSSEKLTFAHNDPNPRGSGWKKVGNYTPTWDFSNTSKIVHNDTIGENRFRSMWSTTTEHIGYIKWQRWVE